MGREPPAHQRALLRELSYLFGPEVGPELQTHGYSFAERLAGDEELVAEICRRFEAARSESRFPILSALLTEISDEELEEFFRSGWANMALPSRESSVQRPWDPSPWDGDLEAYREDLYAGMAFGMRDMRAFAREWLEELLRVGYYGMEESLGLPFKQRSGDYFAPPKPLPLYGNAYPTRIAETGQTIWIRLDGPRSPERGYREISVSDEPLRTDAAIVAALTALEAKPLDLGALRKVLEIGLPLRGESFWDRWNRALGDDRIEEDLRRSLRELRHHQALDYVLMLLRYHRPGFDDLPHQEKTNLVVDACGHTNEFLEALRKLVAFLEHGQLHFRGPAAIKVASKDVAAAVLRDVDGLTNREIGERLGVPLPTDFRIKADHPTVRKMVGRGRRALKAALGEDRWKEHVRAMKDEAEAWRSRSPVQRQAELEAEALGVPYDEVLRRLEEESRRSSGESKHGIREGVAF
jgi:hypothetical protein